MSSLTLLLLQFADHQIETFIGLVAHEIAQLGDEAEAAWQTVWKFLGDHHGDEARDQAFAHAVALGHIQRPTT